MAAAAFSAGAAVAVVALAFALYALIEPHLGRAGAAACVALAVAALMALGGAIMAWIGRRRRARLAVPTGLLEQAIAFVQQKPVVAASAAVGAGLMAIRNPKYLGEVLRAFFEKNPTKK